MPDTYSSAVDRSAAIATRAIELQQAARERAERIEAMKLRLAMMRDRIDLLYENSAPPRLVPEDVDS